MITKNRTAKHQRLKKHIRLRISGTTERPRLTIFKSQRHVYAQIAIGKKVGQLIAQHAREKNITQVVFDRNGYLYHGVVKATADGAREGGLKF